MFLSAVAARKARLENNQTVQQAPPPPSPPANVIPRRRPANNEAVQNSRKKRKKGSHRNEKRRYFDVHDGPEGLGGETEVVVDQISSQSDEDVGISGSKTLEPVGQLQSEPPVVLLNDSSDEGPDFEGDGLDILVRAAPRVPPPSDYRVISTFHPVLERNTFRLSGDDISHLESPSSTGNDIHTLLVLEPTEILALLGVYSITVIQGCISLSGVALSASRKSYHVFAPRSSPIPVLKVVPLYPATNPSSSQSLLPERFCALSLHTGAIVVLHELKTGVKGLARVCRTFDGVFEPSRHQNIDDTLRLLPDVHLLTHEGRDTQAFTLPQSWDTALSAALPSHNDSPTCEPGVYLVKGPKKSGKSTFTVTLLNRLVTRYRKVAFLECDIGQSEFTPAGMVALNIIESFVFGPSFTHLTIPTYAHFIGATSPRSSPSHYISSIQALLETYRMDIQSPAIDSSDMDEGDEREADIIPLVVNTMGWNKGLGADLAHKIENIVQPTAIFEFRSPAARTDWPDVGVASTVYHYVTAHQPTPYILDPAPSPILSKNYTPSDRRTISILSYFHAVFPPLIPGGLRQISVTSWNTSLPLCACPPYEVDWSLAVDRVFLMGAGAEDVVPQEIKRVLNGAIVGLISCDPGSIDGPTSPSQVDRSLIPYVQGSPPPSPSRSNCLGLALIRGLSPSSTHTHVLTPLPPSVLGKGRIMVKGELELPVWGMLDFNNNNDWAEKGAVPYLQWGKGDGVGADRRRVRRNLMRKSQM